jgi:hypothetical protein
MADKWPLANGNWSNAANWNGGTKPVAGDDVFADGRTLNVDESFDVATLRNTQRSGGTIGGSFVFNTAGVTGDVTSLILNNNTFFATISNTTGIVTLNVTNSFNIIGQVNAILISGAGNFILTVPNVGYLLTTFANTNAISKTGTGNMTINGNLIGYNGSFSTGNNNVNLLSVTSGNITINGNISYTDSTRQGVSTSATLLFNSTGNLTINGNIEGCQVGTLAGVVTVRINSGNFTHNGNINNGINNLLVNAGSVLINGNINSGSITTSVNTTINGDITTGVSSGVISTTANIINVTGTVTASATAEAIRMTNANGQVYLNGNMVNNNGKMAIYAPIVWLDANNTTQADFFTSGGVARTLYSEDTFPNMPAEADTRDNIVYGPGSGLRGTLKMPAAADTRNGVVYDNGTTGTALFTTSLFLTELSSSTVPVAVRMQNLCTPMILGELMEAYKK